MCIASIFFKIQVDFGISAFEIRDHITTERWDAREECGREYWEDLQIFLSGATAKRSIAEHGIFNETTQDSLFYDILEVESPSSSLSPMFPVYTWNGEGNELLMKRANEVCTCTHFAHFLQDESI
jgi:hypothetical protein